MPLDPAQGFALDTAGRQAERLADLERRVRAIEGGATILAGVGAPTLAARDGTLYVATDLLRLYVRATGVWRYTGLT